MATRFPYAAKVMSIGVVVKALVMGTLVTVLAATTFIQSIILVLISAMATGVFGLLIVLIQVHAEKEMHNRVNQLEQQVETKTEEIKTKADELAVTAQEVSVTTQGIAAAVNPSEQ